MASPREPKHVKALIKKHREQPRTTVGQPTLWDRFKARKSKS